MRITLLSLMLPLMLAPVLAAVDNAALRTQSVFVEAESFTPANDDWKPGAGWNDDIYSPTSANAVLGNGGGGMGTATREVVVPAAGTYHVWVRYLSINRYPGTFSLKITQAGQEVFAGEYRTKPEREVWEPIWEKFPATLAAGPATLVLGLAKPGIRQRVDCVLLTAVLDYAADYRDFAPQTFVRLRLLEPSAPAKAKLTIYLKREPVYYHHPGWVTAGGLGPDGAPLAPGQWSPWLDLTRYMDTDKFQATVKFAFVADSKPVDRVKATYQVGQQPDEATATTLNDDIDGDISTLILPGDLKLHPQVVTLASDLSRRHFEQARAHGFPPVRETLIPLETYMTGWGDAFNSTRMLDGEMGGAAALGLNSFNGLYGKRYQIAAARGVKRGFCSDWFPDRGWTCPTAPDLPKLFDDHFAKLAAKMTTEDPGALRRHYRNILWDEPGSTNFEHLQKCPVCLAGFGRYLEGQGLKPGDFGQATWATVKPLAREAAVDATTRKLHYWSIQYRDYTNAMMVKLGTDACRRHYGPEMLTSVNFTNGPINGWIGSMTWGPDWFLFGRTQAATLLWSEDWASPGPECSGLTVDMLRAAARPHKLAVGQYIIANVAATLGQRSWSALMHGAKILHYYCWGPYYTFADGMISDNLETQKALGKVTADIARLDPYLHPAQVAPAQVAILWGKSHEIWQDDSFVGTERRLVYLACQHRHVPVDMVGEQDVADGILSDYKLLYLGESNVSRAAAEKVVAWVKAGGVLQMGAGSGRFDEYNDPLDLLTDLAGVKGSDVDKPRGGARERYELRGMRPRAELNLPATPYWTACKFPLLGYAETATAAGAEVLATYTEGQPAIFLGRAGKGTVLRLTFMPGLAYFQGAKGDAQELRTGFDPAQLTLLTAGMTLAGVTAPLTVSEPLVEAQILRGPKADVVMLANWSGKALPAVTVTVHGAAAAKTVESNADAPIQVARQGADLVVTLALGDVEAVVLGK